MNQRIFSRRDFLTKSGKRRNVIEKLVLWFYNQPLPFLSNVKFLADTLLPFLALESNHESSAARQEWYIIEWSCDCSLIVSVSAVPDSIYSAFCHFCLSEILIIAWYSFDKGKTNWMSLKTKSSDYNSSWVSLSSRLCIHESHDDCAQ